MLQLQELCLGSDLARKILARKKLFVTVVVYIELALISKNCNAHL